MPRPKRFGMCPICSGFRKPSGWRSACAPRPSRTWSSSAIPAPKPWSAASRWHANTNTYPGGQRKFLEGFGPTVEGFDQVPFGDLDAVKKSIGPETGAILIEPIQGEGGVRVVPTPFLRSLRELCDLHDLMLVFDEVQTGI